MPSPVSITALEILFVVITPGLIRSVLCPSCFWARVRNPSVGNILLRLFLFALPR